MASMTFLTGPRTGEKVSLDKDKMTFGRSQSCDCILTHPTVSREHFYIEHNNGKLFLVDRGSENGTLANDERVSWVELKDGDKIQAGPFTLVFEMGEARTESAELPAADERPGVEVSAGGRSFDAEHAAMYPREYLEGIQLFNAARYFDAHEVLEEIWLRSSGETKLFYQMLIQAAVGLHHYEGGNARGARGMYSNVIEKLGRLPSFYMSLDLARFSSQIKTFFAELIDNNNETAPSSDKPRPQIRLLSRDTAEWSL
jgi:hypothetical protein